MKSLEASVYGYLATSFRWNRWYYTAYSGSAFIAKPNVTQVIFCKAVVQGGGVAYRCEGGDDTKQRSVKSTICTANIVGRSTGGTADRRRHSHLRLYCLRSLLNAYMHLLPQQILGCNKSICLFGCFTLKAFKYTCSCTHSTKVTRIRSLLKSVGHLFLKNCTNSVMLEKHKL